MINPNFKVNKEEQGHSKHFVKGFLIGFALGALPAFVLSLLHDSNFSEAGLMAVILGSICGLLAALGGKRMINTLIELLKFGWS